jgi:hypothetical protein
MAAIKLICYIASKQDHGNFLLESLINSATLAVILPG